MTTHFDTQTKVTLPIPHWLVLTLCWLFAILYGVWILPETVFIRHFCLVVGAILSLYVIYPNRRLLLTREAIPIWLIGLLILWVTFHVFFIGHDFERQWDEYTRIWKKIAVGSVFAIGLGMALTSQGHNKSNTSQYWRIIFLGLLLPAITYFAKFGATTLGHKYGVPIPIYLVIDSDHMGSRYGISRAWYVFFCLPAVAISIGVLAMSIKSKSFTLTKNFIYLACIPSTLLIFHIENDRLGMLFGFLLMVIALFYLGLSFLRNRMFLGAMTFVLVTVLSSSLLISSYQNNPTWHSLMADAKVAIQEVDRNDAWRNPWASSVNWPINELGQRVDNSNYLRISWIIVGSRYALKEPLGYGLLSLSFGELDKGHQAVTQMSWSHSALLDFTLGYGVPSLLLLMVATFLAWRNSLKINDFWRLIGAWSLPTFFIVLLVKEISSEVFINTFIFVTVFSAAMNLRDMKHGDMQKH